MTGPPHLYGRDAEVSQVVANLEDAGTCTIVGPGGVGKSALARAVAATVSDRRVVWVDAESAIDAGAVLDELARRLAVVPQPGEATADAIAVELERGGVLVVLDGVEHLGEPLARATTGWPSSSRGGRLLVTSRRPMGLLPIVRIAPLATDGPDTPAARMLRAAVVRLGGDGGALVDRATVQAALDATGGLPAAIELTADYIARFGLPAVVHHPPPVDEIIAVCVERTWALLDATDRLTFERLGLTAGPFTRDLLGCCAPNGAEASNATRLVDVGLLHAVGDRLDLLPPVRRAALALLETHGGTVDGLRVLLQRLDLAAGDPRREVVVITADLDSWVRICSIALGHPDVRTEAVVGVRALVAPMRQALRLRELLSLLERTLDLDTMEPSGLGDLALEAAACAVDFGTPGDARRWLRVAHDAAERLDDDVLRSRAWATEAWLALDGGDHTGAVSMAHRAIAVGHDESVHLHGQRGLAEAWLQAGVLDRAEAVARAVMERAGATAPDGLAARTTLGWCHVERGSYHRAIAHADHLASDVRQRLAVDDINEYLVETDLIALAADPSRRPAAASLDHDQRFSWWMRLQQRIRIAAREPADVWPTTIHLASDVVVLADQVGLAYPRLCATILLGDLTLAAGDIRQAHLTYLQALRDAARGSYRLRGADALDGCASIAAHLGHHDLARQSAAAAHAVRNRAGAQPWPRPSLPERVAPGGPAPGLWLREDLPTNAAVDALAAITLRRPTDPRDTLTRAERHVADLVRAGLGNQEIADRLVVSRRTVESHLNRIYRKLGIRSRTQLATLGRTDPR